MRKPSQLRSLIVETWGMVLTILRRRERIAAKLLSWWRRILLFLFYRGVKTGDLILFAALSPVLGVLILDFNSFVLGWNEGRGGLLFAILFLIIEWTDSRKTLEAQTSRGRMAVWLISVIALTTYFFSVYVLGLQEAISLSGGSLGISKEGRLSWTWLWEYVIFGAFLAACLGLIFDLRGITENITPIVYCAGTAIILLLDAVFPYQSLGALAATVPLIVLSTVSLLGISGVRVVDTPFEAGEGPWVYPEGNLLFMKGHKGLMVLEINWPCAGILSMLVYMLVVVILMVKMDAPLRRKVMYAAVGAIGTFLINILRIFSITLAVAYSNVDLRVFHETIGEVLFIIWIMIYLVTTVSVESSLSKKGLKRTPHLDIR